HHASKIALGVQATIIPSKKLFTSVMVRLRGLRPMAARRLRADSTGRKHAQAGQHCRSRMEPNSSGGTCKNRVDDNAIIAVGTKGELSRSCSILAQGVGNANG